MRLMKPASDIFCGPASQKTAKTIVKRRVAKKKDMKETMKEAVKEVVAVEGCCDLEKASKRIKRESARSRGVFVKRRTAKKKDMKETMKEAVKEVVPVECCELEKASKRMERESTGSRGVLTVTSEISELPAPSVAVEVSHDQHLEGIAPSLRPRLTKEKGNKHDGQPVNQIMSVNNVIDVGMDESLGIPAFREHMKTVQLPVVKLNSKRRKRKVSGVMDDVEQHFTMLERELLVKKPGKQLKVRYLEKGSEGKESSMNGVEDPIIKVGEKHEGLYGSQFKSGPSGRGMPRQLR